MTITVLVLMALAAGEAVTLVKMRKQSKRIVKLEEKGEAIPDKTDLKTGGGGGVLSLWDKIAYLCKFNNATTLIDWA